MTQCLQLMSAGKAAKYIGRLGFKLARNFASDEPKSLPNSRPVEDDGQSNAADARKGMHHLRAMTAANDGTVWVAFKTGRIERFKFNGKLLWSKVNSMPHCVTALPCCNEQTPEVGPTCFSKVILHHY